MTGARIEQLLPWFLHYCFPWFSTSTQDFKYHFQCLEQRMQVPKKLTYRCPQIRVQLVAKKIKAIHWTINVWKRAYLNKKVWLSSLEMVQTSIPIFPLQSAHAIKKVFLAHFLINQDMNFSWKKPSVLRWTVLWIFTSYGGSKMQKILLFSPPYNTKAPPPKNICYFHS